MDDAHFEQRLVRIERTSRCLRYTCIGQAIFLAVLCLWATRSRVVEAQSSANILRVRGLIVEDSAGRPRILLGAPFPSVKERMRQDATTTAMLFIDEQGHDRLTLGEELQPQVGGKIGLHRIASGFGVVIHDGNGDERGAYGWLSNGRALITLDRPGAEAWATVVNDKTGEAATVFGFPPQVANDTTAIKIGTRGTAAFVAFNDKSGNNRALFQSENGASPAFQLFDNAAHTARRIRLQ
jgi:hypothetical protein